MVPSPTVRRRRLARDLARLRSEAGLTARDAAAGLEWSEGKVLYLEAGHSPRPNPRDVADLADLYAARGAKISRALRTALIQLARDSRRKGWWQQYGGILNAEYSTLVGLEAEASSIFAVQPCLVPGLLQTERYAHAVAGDSLPEATVGRWVQLRMERQNVLTRGEDPLRLWAVLSEQVIRQQVGSPAILCEQLDHLLKLGSLPNVDIQVVPFSAGMWPGLLGAFCLIQFPDPADPDVAYMESPAGQYFAEEHDQVIQYHREHQRCVAAGHGPARSLQLIADTAAQLPT